MLYSIFKDFAGPIATVIAASAAAYFARQQWKTAEEKVRLDLFDRRFATYQELRAEASIARMGHESAVVAFKTAASRAQFLFGPEVTSFLEATHGDLAADVVQWKSPRSDSPVHHKAGEDRLVARANRLDAFDSRLDTLVAPYMKHHQKLPWSFLARLGGRVRRAVKRASQWLGRLSQKVRSTSKLFHSTRA